MRVLAYARVSSLEQAQGSSLQDQQDSIASYASLRRLKVARFYVEAESALREKIERREQMRALLADVRRGDLVLCDKVDRWSRDPEFTYRSIRQILEAGASFYAVGDGCDPSTAEGDTMLNFRILFAREEHKRIKQRMVGTRRVMRDKGYYTEGLPPIGYRRAHPRGYKGAEKNILTLHAEEAVCVRAVFRQAIAGRSISRIMEATGLGRDRVKDILSRRLYTGEIQNSRGEWIAGRHPAIVDAGTYARAREAVDGRRLGGPRPRHAGARTDSWFLRDVAVCAFCGSRMSASYGRTREYYRCSHLCVRTYVPVLDIEARAEVQILAHLRTLSVELSRVPKAAAVIDNTAKIAALQQSRSRLLDAYAESLMTAGELRSRLAKVDEKRMRLEAQAPVVNQAARREALREVTAIAKAWGAMSGPERRQAVNILVARADLAPTKVALHWRDASDLQAEE